jgi:DNA-binding SARP family transcriptional activator
MCLLAQAQMAFDRGDDRSGLAFLRKALSLGREKGYVNTYYWQPAVMASLCQKGLEAGMEVGYVQTIIRKRSLMPDPSPYECDLWPWPLRINTLGRFAVVKDGEPVQFPVRAPRKVLSLLKALIAFGRDGASEEPLIDTLWPDADGDTAQQTLDTTLHRLRQLLGDEKLLQHREGHLRLDRRACMVDAHTFEALLERGEAAPSLDLIEKALALYQGPFLGSDLGEPWAVSYRERLRSKFLRAARRLGNQLEKTGQTDQAIEGYQKALEVDGLAEEFYRHLMVCYASQGRRADALATYERCRRTLQLALGIEPSAETTAIYESIRFSSPKTAPAKSPAR